MLKLPKKASRKEVLELLATSASYGNLGLFIGAGFSKAVLNESADDEIALSWGDLLQKASKKMDVDYGSVRSIGISYPEIASAICRVYGDTEKVSFKESLDRLKTEISALTCWYPDDEQRHRYSNYLESFAPSWIITTNYDLVIESLLTGKSITLGPNDPLSAPKGVVPVFHLHGVRTNPEGIIIAQEDYVTLFRPSEYRQIKLALTIKESTTLLLGYGLGDVNVLTALDWSRHVFRRGRVNYPHGVIQILRKEEKPMDLPYRSANGVVVLETEQLSGFFEEFNDVRNEVMKAEEKKRRALEKIATRLRSGESSMITRFIDDEKFRTEMLAALSQFPIQLVDTFVPFFEKCIDETWERASPSGAFHAYDENLNIILDILTAFPLDTFPPALLQKSTYALQRVGPFVGDGLGEAWDAKKTWDKRAPELSLDLIQELKTIGGQYRYHQVKRLIDSIPK